MDSGPTLRKVRLTRPTTSGDRSLSVRPHTSPAQQAILQRIIRQLQSGDQLIESCNLLEEDLLQLLAAERMAIYQKDPRRNELVPIFSSAGTSSRRLLIGLESIGGYVAMTGKPISLQDAYDADERANLHPDLQFDDTQDQQEGLLTESMLCLPIKSHDTLLGVLELLNKRPHGAFSQTDLQHATLIARELGERFHYEMKASRSPYDTLIDRGLVTAGLLRQLEKQAEETHEPLSMLLKRKAGVDTADIGASLEDYYMVPFLAWSEGVTPCKEIIDQLNSDWLATNRWVPVRSEDDALIILIDNPNHSERLLEIQQLLNMTIYDVRVGLPEDILRFLGIDPKRYLPSEQALGDLDGLGNQEEQLDDEQVEEELTAENESQIINLVNQLILQAVQRDASDIHLHPPLGKAPGYARLRVDGICRDFADIPASIYGPVVARLKILSNLDIAERRRPQDGKIAVTLEGEPLELRLATVPTVTGESIVLRLLASGEPLPFSKLNFSERNLGFLTHAMEHPHGIILVVGPTGSGKTTTLHGLLGHMNTPERHILTAEDPVEITQPGLQQLQVQPRIGLTFAAALRSFLRADPDIILIGEMRDQETAHAGIEASLTGHLVFSTLHTNSAAETVVRLLDMQLDPINFADALVAIIAQRLVRTICKHCREPYTPNQEELDRLKHLYGKEHWAELWRVEDDLQLYQGRGCQACDGTGYKGRTGIHEVLPGSKTIKRAISRRATVSEIQELACEEGMRSLVQDGVGKLLAGQIDLTQLRRVTVS